METQPESPVSKSGTSSFGKYIRIFLLVLIVIGIVLLCSINFWVPKLVATLIKPETQVMDSKSETTQTTSVTDLLAETHAICDPKEATDGPIGLSECISAQAEGYMDSLNASYKVLVEQYMEQS